MKSFTQSCTEFFLTWIMLSEFHRGVALVEVVGRGLTALSKSLLAEDSYFGGMTARRGEGFVLASRASGMII